MFHNLTEALSFYKAANRQEAAAAALSELDVLEREALEEIDAKMGLCLSILEDARGRDGTL